MRFIDGLRQQAGNPGVLLPEELGKSVKLWTRYIQKKQFSEVLDMEVPRKKSSLRCKLGIYTDSDGVLRCGGRFQLIQPHPKLLPKAKDSYYVRLLIESVHKRIIHAGESQTLAELRREYWIIQGRSSVRKVIRQCLVCKRWEGGPFRTPPFAPLPDYSTSSDNPPFTFVGLDYLGPLLVKNTENLSKNWICLFTCLNVRAVRLELIEDMSTENFLLCLRRFIARCGTPKIIISDNASQFKAGSEVVQELWKKVSKNSEVQSYIADYGIQWKFTVEYALGKGVL